MGNENAYVSPQILYMHCMLPSSILVIHPCTCKERENNSGEGSFPKLVKGHIGLCL